MAHRPESKSGKPLRDVRAEEEAKFLPLDDALRVIEHCTDWLYDNHSKLPWVTLRDTHAVGTLLMTGLRAMGLRGLTIKDFVTRQAVLYCLEKNNRYDYVPLHPKATLHLNWWTNMKRTVNEPCSPTDPFYASMSLADEKFLSYHTLRRSWLGVLQANGLKHYKLHATRHTAGLIVLAGGATIAEVSRFLRHANVGVTERHYLHVDVGRLRQKMSSPEMWQLRSDEVSR